MEHSIEVNKATGVCVIRASGTIRRPEDSLVLLRLAGEVAREKSCSRLLFDVREADIVGTTMGAYGAVIAPEEHGVSRQLRIAVVYSALTRDERFMEDVGVNRGSRAFKVFDDIGAAQEWVRQ